MEGQESPWGEPKDRQGPRQTRGRKGNAMVLLTARRIPLSELLWLGLARQAGRTARITRALDYLECRALRMEG